MHNLDDVASKYLLDPGVEIENDLILNWYPKRVRARIGHVGSLLELGLGHGYTVPHFFAMTDHHEVIEGAPSVIRHFQQKNPWYSGKLVEGYFETYQPERKFDLIVMGFVLEHVDDPAAILARYRNFLTDKGRIIAAVPNAKSLNRRLGVEMGMIDDIYDLNETDHKLGHKRNFCRETFRAMAEEAGCCVMHQEGIYLKPLPLSVLKTLDDLPANLDAMLKVGIDFPDLCVGLLFELVNDPSGTDS